MSDSQITQSTKYKHLTDEERLEIQECLYAEESVIPNNDRK
jgi:hypothetical protein